ncbi:hypothetical protein MLE62_005278, partial [Klebsiella pneumoniae]|nr:hypothetical protein [Klebsiella pneumoniae]
MKYLMFVAPCAAVITKPTLRKVTNAMKKPMTKLSVISAVSKVLTRTALTTAARITPMTDITKLAQRARINAECGEHLSPAETMELVEALESEKRICATWRKTAESTGEKLEKVQQRITQLEARTVNISVPDARNEDYDWDGQTPSEAFNTCRMICALMFRQSL